MRNVEAFDYQKRLIAFIDVLGFSGLVQASENDIDARNKLKTLITTNKLFEQFFEKVLNLGEVAFFSDSFVLSMQTDQVIYLVREAGYLCRHLLSLGFPCRGAIVMGSLYHHGRIVVGPAMVRAYQLEQSVAVYPRVILDETAMDCWREEFAGESAHPHLKSLVKCAPDGLNFLDIFDPGWSDFIPWTEAVSLPDAVPMVESDFVNVAREKIKAGLVTSKGSAKVHAKYQWLATECGEGKPD